MKFFSIDDAAAHRMSQETEEVLKHKLFQSFLDSFVFNWG